MSTWKTIALMAFTLSLVSCGSINLNKGARTPGAEANQTYELRQRAQLERELGNILGKTAFISDYQMKEDEVF